MKLAQIGNNARLQQKLSNAVVRENTSRRQCKQMAVTSSTIPQSHQQSLEALKILESTGENRYTMESKPCIIAIGLTVHGAPVSLREKLAVPQPEWPRAIEELTEYPHIEEAGVLSTCNRMELYIVALSWHRGVREAEEWMSKSSGVSVDELRPYLFLHKDNDAIDHLMSVSAGLESLVMGEGQILAQVKAVFQTGQKCSGFGRKLNGLFNYAIAAGKRVRTETSICSGSVSVSSAAVELTQLKLPGNTFDNAKVAIIGAGKMSTLLVKHLISKGCKSATILNRSAPRAEQLKEDFPDLDITVKLMDELMDVVSNSDVIYAASGSEELLITQEMLSGLPTPSEAVGGARRFVDISVPRNIDQKVNELDDGIVYNVDDLVEVVEGNKAARLAAAQEARYILDHERSNFCTWRDSLETVPTIKALRFMAEDIRSKEVERTLKKMGDGMTKKQRRAVEDLSKGIVAKLLHGPMKSLRSDSSGKDEVSLILQNMEAIERMYGLAKEPVQKQ